MDSKKASLPCALCNGKCCYYPTMSKKEFKTIVKKYGLPEGTIAQTREMCISHIKGIEPGEMAYVPHLMGGRCPWFINGACSIYKDRPQVCRDYGIVEAMPCMFLYTAEALAKTEEMLKKSREAVRWKSR